MPVTAANRVGLTLLRDKIHRTRSSEDPAMRMEVHVHADIPILEGVSRKQIEQALAPWLEYLDAENLSDVKSLEPEEPGLRFDEKELILYLCWTGEIGKSFHAAFDKSLDQLGPYCYEAVEVDLTIYGDNDEQENRLLFVGPTAQAIHEAQRRCMVEDIGALLGRHFGKERVAEVMVLVNDMFDRDWKEKAVEGKQPERSFEHLPRPSRKHLH
jgi:phenylpyruvate tautomerase PptA (4-oxalocrotonate tautomerase family)